MAIALSLSTRYIKSSKLSSSIFQTLPRVCLFGAWFMMAKPARYQDFFIWSFALRHKRRKLPRADPCKGSRLMDTSRHSLTGDLFMGIFGAHRRPSNPYGLTMIEPFKRQHMSCLSTRKDRSIRPCFRKLQYSIQPPSFGPHLSRSGKNSNA